jgi:hypothetical protein
VTIEPDFYFKGVPIYGEYDHCPIEGQFAAIYAEYSPQLTSCWLEIQVLKYELTWGF